MRTVCQAFGLGYPQLSQNSLCRSACLCLLPGAGIKGADHHARLATFVLTLLISGLKNRIKDTQGLLEVGVTLAWVPTFCLSVWLLKGKGLGLETQGAAIGPHQDSMISVSVSAVVKKAKTIQYIIHFTWGAKGSIKWGLGLRRCKHQGPRLPRKPRTPCCCLLSTQVLGESPPGPLSIIPSLGGE